MSSERLGLVDDIREHRDAVVGANPHLTLKITGKPPAVAATPVVKPRPVFARGRYIPRSLSDLIDAVCLMSDIHRDGLTGNGRTRRLVDARSCVAVLAAEFAPRNSYQAVDDALLRGSGCCVWYRDRHEDRLKLYPEYRALYDRCRAAIKRGLP